MAEHQNVGKKRFCTTCEHAHFPNPQKGAMGMCLLEPPRPWLIGMAPSALQVKPDVASSTPIVRAFYPTIGDSDTCSRWSMRTDGEG